METAANRTSRTPYFPSFTKLQVFLYRLSPENFLAEKNRGAYIRRCRNVFCYEPEKFIAASVTGDFHQ
jgi:hypothetical protein